MKVLKDLTDLLGDSVDLFGDSVELADLDQAKNDSAQSDRKRGRKYDLTGTCLVCGALANDQHRHVTHNTATA